MTSQMYFPEEVTAAVHGAAPYSARGQKDTSNAADAVSRNDPPPLLTITPSGSGYGAAATFATAFGGWRRWAAAVALGLVVAGTLMAGVGKSLAEGRNFGTAIVLGLAFCAPAILAVVFAPEAVERATAFVASRRNG